VSDELEIVSVRSGPALRAPVHEHIVAVKLRDGRELRATRVIRGITVLHEHYVLTPTPGMHGYAEHAHTGKRVLVQAIHCPTCGEAILWA